jgi:predicted  nucleic acid-binding Zn-ribbon protein
MKFTELQDAFRDYENAMYSPSRSEVRFGCDCGCGGDSYTSESWDAEEEAAADAIERMKTICKEFGIEYDGVE